MIKSRSGTYEKATVLTHGGSYNFEIDIFKIIFFRKNYYFQRREAKKNASDIELLNTEVIVKENQKKLKIIDE